MTSAPGTPGALDGAPGAAAREPARRPSGSTDAGGAHLRAPHRRTTTGPRLREKLVLMGYRTGEWTLARLPWGPTIWVGGWLAVVSYWLWPAKRRIVQGNCARVLDLPPTDRRVAALARKVYRSQTRWVVELMRMSRMERPALAAQIDDAGGAHLEKTWRDNGALVCVGGHFGNNEAGAAGMASRGLPFSAVAEDTAYHELFEWLAAGRRRWGIEVVPWRNLRGTFRVLRKGEILALLVDWGYRPDGVPVRFLGAWTTFPAGPVVLAAKTGAAIVPFSVPRDGRRFRTVVGDPIRVASTAPAELVRATQAYVDVIEAAIRRDPAQWVVFKPMWPHDPAVRERLEAQAKAALAGASDGWTLDSGAGTPGAPDGSSGPAAGAG